MKVTVLIENNLEEQSVLQECASLVSEHGISLYIEFEGKTYLLDAGASGAFMENAAKLGVILGGEQQGKHIRSASDIKDGKDGEVFPICILSHGHYDHAGGFGVYLEENPTAHIYAMESAMEEYYSGSGGIHPIGIPVEIRDVYRDNFILIKETTQIADNVWLIPHSTKGLERIGERAKLYRTTRSEFGIDAEGSETVVIRTKENILLTPDDFSHEMSLVFDTEKGLVIFNSCSHSGIGVIVEEVKAALSGRPIYAFFGGLHMKGTKDGKEICTFSEEEVCRIADIAKEEGMQGVYTGHCTGMVGYQMLEKLMAEKLYPLHTGSAYEI